MTYKDLAEMIGELSEKQKEKVVLVLTIDWGGTTIYVHPEKLSIEKFYCTKNGETTQDKHETVYLKE